MAEHLQVAGSAEQFCRVDLHYVEQAAQAAQQAGVCQFSLCSAQGANANTWASNLTIAHALLYKKTKGQVGSCSRKTLVDPGDACFNCLCNILLQALQRCQERCATV